MIPGGWEIYCMVSPSPYPHQDRISSSHAIPLDTTGGTPVSLQLTLEFEALPFDQRYCTNKDSGSDSGVLSVGYYSHQLMLANIERYNECKSSTLQGK